MGSSLASSGKRVPVYKKIIQDNIKRWVVKEFLEYRLAKLGYIDCDILRSPLGTRIIIYAERPSRIIGRRGQTVRELQQALAAKLGVENPMIDVAPPKERPEYYAKIIANRIAWAMTKGVKFRRAALIAIRQLIEAGVRGVEITISGKLTSERSRFEKFTYGTIYKCGNDAKTKVDRYVGQVLLKPGIYGIEVRLLPPGRRLSDEFYVKTPEQVETKAAEVAEQTQQAQQAESSSSTQS